MENGRDLFKLTKDSILRTSINQTRDNPTEKWTSDKNKINLIYNDNQDDDIEAATIIELTTSELRLEWYWAEMETDGKFYEEWEAYSFKKIGQ